MRPPHAPGPYCHIAETAGKAVKKLVEVSAGQEEAGPPRRESACKPLLGDQAGAGLEKQRVIAAQNQVPGTQAGGCYVPGADVRIAASLRCDDAGPAEEAVQAKKERREPIILPEFFATIYDIPFVLACAGMKRT